MFKSLFNFPNQILSSIIKIYGDIIPSFKSKIKDSSSPDNCYRSIVTATATSMLVLICIQEVISVRENQFGFLINHSTDMYIRVLKDVIIVM